MPSLESYDLHELRDMSPESKMNVARVVRKLQRIEAFKRVDTLIAKLDNLDRRLRHSLKKSNTLKLRKKKSVSALYRLSFW